MKLHIMSLVILGLSHRRCVFDLRSPANITEMCVCIIIAATTFITFEAVVYQIVLSPIFPTHLVSILRIFFVCSAYCLSDVPIDILFYQDCRRFTILYES